MPDTATVDLTIEQRVEAGAAWLDDTQPGWADRIDLDRLDVRSGCRCVLGQLYGSFYNRPIGGAIGEQPEALGFDITDEAAAHPWTEDVEFAALTNAWRALIERRRAEAGAA